MLYYRAWGVLWRWYSMMRIAQMGFYIIFFFALSHRPKSALAIPFSIPPSTSSSLLLPLSSHCLKRRQSLAQGGSNLSPLIGCPQRPQTHRPLRPFLAATSSLQNTLPVALCSSLAVSLLEMASKLFPAAPRAGRQLFQQLPKSQCRAFSAGPQRCSEALAVVRI